MSGTSDGWRTQLIEYVESILAHARELASRTTDEEYERIIDAGERLVDATACLKKIFDSYDALSVGDPCSEPYDPGSAAELLAALSAMRELALLTLQNPTVLRIEKEAQQSRAAHARLVQASRSAQVDQIVGQLAEPYPDIGASKLAESILNDTNKELRMKGIPELKADAVRKRIEKLRDG